MTDSQDLIKKLNLMSHPEGGHFSESFRDENNNVSLIYYLLQRNEWSHWHRLTKNETLHHELTKDINNNIIALTYEYKTFDLSNFGGGEKDSIKGDGLVVYDYSGKLVWKWNVFDHEDPLSYKKINSLKNDWTHGNGIGATHDNNYVLSLRTLNQLWKIDSKNGKILWKLGLNGNIPIEESSRIL